MNLYSEDTSYLDVLDPLRRWMEDSGGNSTAKNDDNTIDPCEKLAGSNDAHVLRNTMRLYGGLFLVMLLAFCILRQKFPRVYNLRNWVDDLKTEIAESQRGFISWTWKLFGITDAEMMDECGMDALCYARVLEFGIKISIVGVLNAIWLIPVYLTANVTETTDCIDDWVVKISVSNLPSGSYRFCATVVGAYVVFGYTMYTFLQEFMWFSRYRHQFLAKKLPRNYCVYVQCIPEEYRSNAKLLDFFQQSSSQGSVLEARLAVKTPHLGKKVAEREALIAKLEHAINKEEIRGVAPVRRTGGAIPVLGRQSSSIESMFQELQDLNATISESIDRIERTARGLPSIHEDRHEIIDTITLDYPAALMESAGTYGATAADEESRVSALTVDKGGASVATEENSSDRKPTTAKTSLLFNNPATNGLKSSLKTAANVAGTSLKTAANAAGTVANAAANLLSTEDGVFHSAGFVTFKTLRAAQTAQQMIQYAEPFAMEVLEAPHPEDVLWSNVGKTHKELQLGKLISFGLTATLCLLWTIPMGFISTLSSIEGLRGEIKLIDELLNDLPWLEPLFAQLAPLLIVVANEVLKMILEMLSGIEGPISGAVVQAKLFSKLSSFMIIQTFFVTAIGGSIIAELSALLQEPGLIIDLLANTLPTQSTFYIQILLVDTFLNLGIELLRVTAVAMALIRSRVGPKLTEKERSTTWMGIRPLSDPSEFDHANLLAGTVLYFTVFFVYAALAPLTTIFMLLCFALMAAGYRHQFVYIYPTFPDSGGKLWAAFMRMVPVCMIIAQFTIVGMLALNKTATASAMMIPLVVITVLFTFYIHQKHFTLTEYLPAKDAVMADLRNNSEREMTFEFVKNKYIQPELRKREILPENATVEREMEHGCLEFITPPGSENGE